MDIPLSLNIIVEITLFVIAGVGAIMAYLIAEIRTDVKEIRAETKEDRSKYEALDRRLGTIETRVNICEHCPNPMTE